jgi:hypothetical protein
MKMRCLVIGLLRIAGGGWWKHVDEPKNGFFNF